MMNRILGRLAVLSLLTLGVGCGGTELDAVQSEPLDAMAQAAEEPRKAEDLLGALDRKQGVLHAVDDSRGIVLEQLKAQDAGNGTYVSKDELTGEEWRYSLKLYSRSSWFPFLKRCPNGQYVLRTMECPSILISDPLVRVWQNSSCSLRLQQASTSACTNVSTGGSYRYQYVESWKCGVGTGFCVERPAITAIRYDYSLSMCDPAVITNVQGTNHNYLCKR